MGHETGLQRKEGERGWSGGRKLTQHKSLTEAEIGRVGSQQEGLLSG